MTKFQRGELETLEDYSEWFGVYADASYEETNRVYNEYIEEQLVQIPNLNPHEFANWKQEINQMPNLAALTAYQNSLLKKIEEQKEQQLEQSKVVGSARKEKNLIPWIGLGKCPIGRSGLFGFLFQKS